MSVSEDIPQPVAASATTASPASPRVEANGASAGVQPWPTPPQVEAGDLEAEASVAAVATTASTARARRWSPRRIRTFQTIFEVPAYRWYLLSMVGNFAAMQMQMIARGFLTYEITGSFAALGTVELANTFPRLIFALSGGVVADRRSRRAITQIGQAFNGGVAAVLAALLFAGMLRFEHLVIAAILQGISNSFALPARQAMVPEIVGMERLTNALALNVSMMSTLRLGAPALAGFLIAAVGAGWVFALMAGLYAFSVITLFKVTMPRNAESEVGGAPLRRPAVKRSGGRGAIADIKDALVYLWQLPVLRMLLVVDMFLGMLMFPYQRLLPGFVSEVLSENADQTAIRMGMLLTFTAVGALGGSLFVASLPNKMRGKLVIASVVLFALGLLAFSASTVFYVSLGIAVIMGVGQAGRQALNNILIQTLTSNEFRGRISSIMLFEDGIESLGIFAIALLAAAIGPQLALGATALTLLALAATMWLLMPSYRRLD